MRSKIDARSDRAKGRRKGKSPKGGKALQRLLSYLEERDPNLIPEALPVDVPASTIALRTFVPGEDEDDWLAVNNRSFADHPAVSTA